jgi:hypothetical protein
MSNQQRTLVIVQVAVLTIVCIGLGVLAYVFGVFKPPKDTRILTLRIESTSGAIQYTYSVPGDERKTTETTSSPWEKSIGVKVGSEIYLIGGNPNQMGSIACTLLLDGKVWKKQTAKYPDDKVSCAGIVP